MPYLVGGRYIFWLKVRAQTRKANQCIPLATLPVGVGLFYRACFGMDPVAISMDGFLVDTGLYKTQIWDLFTQFRWVTTYEGGQGILFDGRHCVREMSSAELTSL